MASAPRPARKPALPTGLGRPSAARRGYGGRWALRRAAYLREHPVCEDCGREWASEVDHVVALRRGGHDGPSNYRALCKSCHSRKTVAEDGGFGR